MKRSLAFLAIGLLSTLRAATTRAESGIAIPYIVLEDVVVHEGNSGMTHFKSLVRLSGWFEPVDVDVQAIAGSASAADFSFKTVHLKLLPEIAQTVEGDVIGDLAPEGTETFNLQVAGTSGQVISAGGRITIADDDGPDGGPPDASPDATPDLGVPDLGIDQAVMTDLAPIDQATDLGTTTDLAAPAPDAGAPAPAKSSGCAIGGGAAGAPLALFALAALILRRRR